MRRFLIGLLLVLHGLAHAAFGMAAQDLPGRAGTALSGPPRVWLATALFLGATPGLVAAGFGVWRTIGLERRWRELVYVGAISSSALLLMFPRGVLQTIVGLSLDGLVVMIAMQLAPRWVGVSTPAKQGDG